MSTTAQDRTARTVRLVLLGTVPRAPLPERAPGPIAEAIAAHDPHVVGEFVTARDYWLGDTVLLGGRRQGRRGPMVKAAPRAA
jgi:hypothetical protein